MPKVLSDSFKPFELERTIVLKGGFLKDPISMPLASVPAAGDFVKMDKRMDWIIKAVAGKLANRTALVRTTLLDKLKDKICSALGRDADVAAAVAADDGHDEAMDALGISEDEAEQPKELKTKKRKYSKVASEQKNITLVVQMPARCLEKYPDCTDAREVRLWLRDRRTVLVHTDAVPWALEYMHDQYELGGVSRAVTNPTEETISAPAVASCEFGDCSTPEKPLVRIAWDFEQGSWEATVQTPSKPGSQERRLLNPKELSFDKASLVGTVSSADELATMIYSEKKALAYASLECWANDVLAG